MYCFLSCHIQTNILHYFQVLHTHTVHTFDFCTTFMYYVFCDKYRKRHHTQNFNVKLFLDHPVHSALEERCFNASTNNANFIPLNWGGNFINKSADIKENGKEGWSFFYRTADIDFSLRKLGPFTSSSPYFRAQKTFFNLHFSSDLQKISSSWPTRPRPIGGHYFHLWHPVRPSVKQNHSSTLAQKHATTLHEDQVWVKIRKACSCIFLISNTLPLLMEQIFSHWDSIFGRRSLLVLVLPSDSASSLSLPPIAYLGEGQGARARGLTLRGRKIKKYKTGVINYPLDQTHSFASSKHGFRFKFLLFWKVGTDGRHVQKQWSLPAVTVSRPRGSIFENHCQIVKFFPLLKKSHCYSIS